jgi:hypothetical protein
MIQNGFSDQYTLYQFDFHPQDSDQASLLNRRGKRELAEIAQKYRAVPVPVLIERSRLPALDAARRQHVLEQLRQAGVQSPDEFVFVGAAPGYLEGVEAVEVYKRFLSLSRPRGASAAPNRTPPPSAGVPPQ